MSRTQACLAVLGHLLVVAGVAMISVPAALIVFGVGLILDAFHTGRREP